MVTFVEDQNTINFVEGGHRVGWPVMPQIMIRCLKTDKAVPTGLNTELINPDSIIAAIIAIYSGMASFCALRLRKERPLRDVRGEDGIYR
jgi:hypothetical protein